MHWPVYLASLLLLFADLDALKLEPHPTCADHLLNGQFRTGILPLQYGDEVFNVECVMPRMANNFADPQTETTIRNALEKTHDLLNEKRTIGYQIQNWDFLAAIVKEQQCEQDLTIDWQPLSIDGTQGFEIESVLGIRKEFVANYSKGITEFVKLTSDGHGAVGVVHLIPTGNSSFTAKVKLSPLRCRQKVIRDHSCKFELNAAHDRIKVATSSANELSFSFQTDKPMSGFLRLHGKSADLHIRIEDGYLINLNGASYAIRSLADGNFHRVDLNFKTKIMRFDGQDPGISFDVAFLRSGIKQVDILVNGSVTAIRLDNGDWQCNKSRFLTINQSATPLRQFCPIGEPSFCQCKAPASVIAGNNGLYNSEPKCTAPNAEKGFTLKRDPSKLSFFYFSQTSIGQSVSTVFKSDAHSGLIFFGQRKGGTGVERYQVHYSDDTILAGACLQDGVNQWICKSCEIKRINGIASNDWVRVSLFNSSNSYMFLAVDDQICRLTQNDNYSSHQLYKGPEKLSFLFVGGTFYKKLNTAEDGTRSDFKSDFYELTNLKPLSILGCIAEIRVDGKEMDLVKQFNQQALQVLKDSNQKADLFAMTRGCDECSLQCNGLPCRSSQAKGQFCDCSFGYGGLPTEDGKCSSDGMNALWLNSTIPLTLTVPVHPPYRKHVSKMWTLIRLPQISTPTKILEFARFHITVNEKQVIIGSDWYGINKKFDIDSFDERLHLISIEQAPAIFESRKRFVFRVDSQVQEELLHNENSLENEFDVSLTTLKADSDKFGGCIEGIYFALENDREQESEISFVDVNKRLAANNGSRFAASRLQVHRQSCGIVDPNLWKEEKSSALGFVGSYDPYGLRQKIKSEDDGFPWLLLILLIAFILFFIILGCIYLVMKHGGKRTYVLAKETAVEETRPLYVESNNSPQSAKLHNGPEIEQKSVDVYNTTVTQTPKSANVTLASKSDL